MLSGLADGARHLVRHRAAAAAMGAMATHRFVYGMCTAMLVLLSRYYFAENAEDALNAVSPRGRHLRGRLLPGHPGHAVGHRALRHRAVGADHARHRAGC